jgi:hypothetical protein
MINKQRERNEITTLVFHKHHVNHQDYVYKVCSNRVIGLFLWLCIVAPAEIQSIFCLVLFSTRIGSADAKNDMEPDPQEMLLLLVCTCTCWLHALAYIPKKYFLFVFYYIFEFKIQSDRFYICVSKIFFNKIRPFILYIFKIIIIYLITCIYVPNQPNNVCTTLP